MKSLPTHKSVKKMLENDVKDVKDVKDVIKRLDEKIKRVYILKEIPQCHVELVNTFKSLLE